MAASVPAKGTVLLCDNKRQERELFPALGNNVGSCSGSAKDLTAHLKRTAVEQGQTIGHKDTRIHGYKDTWTGSGTHLSLDAKSKSTADLSTASATTDALIHEQNFFSMLNHAQAYSTGMLLMHTHTHTHTHTHIHTHTHTHTHTHIAPPCTSPTRRNLKAIRHFRQLSPNQPSNNKRQDWNSW